MKTVGGIVFPSHPLATPVDELAKTTAGYGKDMSANIAEAKRLLKEAGHSNLKFTLNNRGVDQPYRVVGTWLIDQWKKAGITVEQRVQPTTPFYATLRKQKDFDVSIDFNCQAVVNPIADVSKFLPTAGNNYASSKTKTGVNGDDLPKAGDEGSQKALMSKYEARVLNDLASQAITMWWYKITRIVAMKG